MSGNQENQQKQSTPDEVANDPMKDLVATAGQSQQSGNQQSGGQQMGQQGGQQQGGQQQGGQQMDQQGSQQSGSQQQGGGQHASGGTPALDDLSGQNQNESAQQASEAFNQQNEGGSGNRQS